VIAYQLAFYIFALLVLVSTVFLVSDRRLGQATMALLLIYHGLTGLALLLSAGPVAVMFLLAGGLGLGTSLFGVSALGARSRSDLRRRSLTGPAWAGVLAGFVFLFICWLILTGDWSHLGLVEIVSMSAPLGRLLLGKYFLALALSGLLLFASFTCVAMIIREARPGVK
jgi:NADH:ubiquinone oxidoreductase subunit 6 (subunit J)